MLWRKSSAKEYRSNVIHRIVVLWIAQEHNTWLFLGNTNINYIISTHTHTHKNKPFALQTKHDKLLKTSNRSHRSRSQIITRQFKDKRVTDGGNNAAVDTNWTHATSVPFRKKNEWTLDWLGLPTCTQQWDVAGGVVGGETLHCRSPQCGN